MRVEDVQAFLRNVAEGKSLLGEQTWEVDRADLRSHFHSSLEALGDWSGSLRHARWASGLDDFADTLERLPEHQLLYRTQEYAHTVLDAAHGEYTGRTLLESHEAARVAKLCLEAGVLTRAYCEEVQIVERGPRAAITPVGRPLLRLSTLDALRWLLTVELAQSGDFDDDARISERLLRDLIEGMSPYFDPHTDDFTWPFPLSSFARLAGFGILAVRYGEGAREPYQVVLKPDFLELVSAVVDRGPWNGAVQSALSDERAAVLPSLRESAVDAGREQVRLITHEVRNALVPTRHHLDALIRTQALDPERLRKAHEGVLRTLKFVDEMVATAELMAPRSAPIDIEVLMWRVLPLVEDAERVQLSPIRGRVEVDIDRTARALANIVSNALQAPNVKRVTFTARAHGATVLITIDDDGQGVAEEARERIFDDGFTTKPGGSGFGLAYARSAVTASGGSIRCERSDLGGARFVVTLRLVESSS